MTFTYNLNIPNAPNNPSADQPLMKTNTNSINSWTGVDHVSFAGIGGEGAGQHLQVTFFDENPPGSTPTDPLSILYTNSTAGQASSVAELYYQNANAILPISAVKAFGVFTANTSTNVTTFNNSFNCASISNSMSNQYVITLNSNVVTGNNICLLALSSRNANINNFPVTSWSFTNPTLTIFCGATSSFPALVSFVVLQF